METKDTLSSCSNSEAQQMQQILDKAKKSCMVSFRQLHSHLKRLSQNDLQGSQTESGFKRAFGTLSCQDTETFTGTMFLNVEQLEKQLDKEDFQEIRPMTAFNVLEIQFQMFITNQDYLNDAYKSIDERVQLKREYDSWVNERQMQTTEEKVDTSQALDASSVDTESNIRRIYDKEPMTESQFLKEKSNEAEVKHDTDVIETINIKLKNKVAKLLKENETLKKNYKELFDSIKSTSAPSTHTNVHAEENNNDQAKEGEQIPDDEFTNPFCVSAQEEVESSSHNIGNSNVPTFNQPIVSEYRWMKDHPLEQVCRNPSRPVQTRRQLATDPEMCMYALIVSTAEPKNIKEVVADSAWIEAMQEELYQFDRLQEEVYVAQPDGFVDPDHLEKVYRLRKAFYGLKQAPRAWYDEFSKFLTSKGFTKGTIDPTLFTIRYRENILLVQIYAKYTLEILHKHGMDKGQSLGTPMAIKPKLDADLSGNPVNQTEYHSKIGSLMYLTSSRPDIVQADSSFELTAFVDADHAGSKAEYIALSASCAQVMWMRTQLQDYGFNYNKILLYCDSHVYSISEGEGDIHQNISVIVQDTPVEEIAFMAIEEDDENNDDDDQDDDNQDHDDQDEVDDDDDQDEDNNDNQNFDEEGEEFIHPKLSILDEEETKDEESFDPILKMPENIDDEGNDEENLGLNVGMKEGQDEEDDEDELYGDVNINLEGRFVQMANVHATQEFEDSHVTLTPVNPDGIESIFGTTSQMDVHVPTIVAPFPLSAPTLTHSTIATISTVPQAPTFSTTATITLLQDLPNFGSLFGFDHRNKTLEANFSEF
nr:hypothetical protein [Tanacetum cinerariifolium]